MVFLCNPKQPVVPLDQQEIRTDIGIQARGESDLEAHLFGLFARSWLGSKNLFL